MDVLFGRTAYVAGCGSDGLDKLSSSSGLNIIMEGVDLVMFDFMDLRDYVEEELQASGEEYEEGSVEHILCSALDSVVDASGTSDPNIGDIVFVK
jgi:hypothetical protein